MGGFGDFPVSAFERLSRALRARLTDYLDLAPHTENRGEVGKALGALQEKLGAALAARRRLSAERAALHAEPAHDATRAEQAIALGRDDLARATIRRRAAIDERAAAIDRDLDALAAEAARIDAMIERRGAVNDGALRRQLAELDQLLAGDKEA
jgi:phage shock protein A